MKDKNKDTDTIKDTLSTPHEQKNDTDKYYGFFNILKTQLLKILKDFTRELEISFEYINKDVLNVLNKRIKSSENNDIRFKNLYLEILSNLDNYKGQLHVAKKEKVRTHELEFLNNIVLLGCSFKVFSDEKKNTKKTLVNYLHEFYNISLFLNTINNTDNKDNNSNDDNMFETIQNMVQQLILQPSTQETQTSSKNKNNNTNTINDNELLNHLANGNVNMDGLNGLKNTPLFSQFNELMQNKDIMRIATELTSEIQLNEIDPMTLMSSIMSGNMQDNKLNNLINTIGDKITKKINDGDIDKNMLEDHANKFMNNLSENKDDLMSLVTNNIKKM
jgi:hypothetical protein